MERMKYTLRELRARVNVRQTDVAEAIGTSVSTYSVWERDTTKMPVGKLEEAAKFLGVSMYDIEIHSKIDEIKTYINAIVE